MESYQLIVPVPVEGSTSTVDVHLCSIRVEELSNLPTPAAVAVSCDSLKSIAVLSQFRKGDYTIVLIPHTLQHEIQWFSCKEEENNSN